LFIEKSAAVTNHVAARVVELADDRNLARDVEPRADAQPVQYRGLLPEGAGRRIARGSCEGEIGVTEVAELVLAVHLSAHVLLWSDERLASGVEHELLGEARFCGPRRSGGV
jgi:hypothetical protein